MTATARSTSMTAGEMPPLKVLRSPLMEELRGVSSSTPNIAGSCGVALSFPGGPRGVHEAVDARLLARALHWAAMTPGAHGEIFNVTNGDVFDWHEVWPVIAESFGMEVGAPTPQRLAETMPARANEWADVADRYDLRSPRDLAAFVGASWHYADVLFSALASRPLPVLLSTVKIRRAGFGECMDTEDMLREWLAIFQDRRLLPPCRR